MTEGGDGAEEPLFGGLQSGRVVKVGDTVRRPSGDWTATVFALLGHLRAKGFPAPEPLGLDKRGREIVSFLPGRACNYPWPPALLETSGARAVGAFVSAYHDAVADFAPPAPAIWRHGPQPLRPGEVALHGDFAPHNLVWGDLAPSGLIDFELARPGMPIEDAAFCVVRAACFRDDERTLRMGFVEPPDRRARLAAFAEGWGAPAADLLAQARVSEVAELDRIARLGARGLEPWASFLRVGLADEARAEIAWLDAHAGALL
ncbi:MAG: phosphotransferase [Caulobacteraceae bacterium]